MADKPLPWFRMYHEAAYDSKFDVIAMSIELDWCTIFGAWSKLLCIAASSPIRGSLYVTFQKRFTNDTIATLLRFNKDQSASLMQAFVECDMLEIDDNGAYHIKNWEKRQFDSDNSTKRVKKYRENSKVKRYSNDDVTPPDTDTETDTNKGNNKIVVVEEPPRPNIFAVYENEIGAITPMMAQSLEDAERMFPAGWVEDAIKEASMNNKRNWKYIEAILKRWNLEGKSTAKKKKTNGRPVEGF